MSNTDTAKAISVRYGELAEKSCCLSCGGAINHGNPQPGEVCVDLGSGRGLDVIRMAEQVGESGHVHGIDISDGMLEKAKKNAEKLGINNVTFRKAELQAVPLDDQSVDLVISNCTINHADDKQKVWNEVFRILKEGGRFVVSDIYSTAQVPDKYRDDPQAVAECWAGSITRAEYEQQLARAGFTDVQILEESDPYSKGSIEVVSWTIYAARPKACGCGCGCS